MTLQEIQNKTLTLTEGLVSQAKNSLDSYVAQLTQSVESVPSAENSTARERSGISPVGMVSLAATAAGVLGWVISNALWAKICLGSGVTLFMIDTFIRKSGKNSKLSAHSASAPSSSLQSGKLDVQKTVENLVNNVDKKWNDSINSYKEELQSLVDKSHASDDNKFKASNIVSLPKRINFQLLPFIKEIVMAKNAEELRVVIDKIELNLEENIRHTGLSQIEAYKEIATLIGK